MTRGPDRDDPAAIRECILSCYTRSPLTSFPLAMRRPPSQESTLTDVSFPDSLFFGLSEASEAESHVTEPLRTSTDAPTRVSCSKGESADALPDIFFNPTLDHIRESKCPLAPLLHLGDISTQPTSRLPQIPFLDPPRPIQRPLPDHAPSVTTRVLTGTRYLPSPVAATEQRSKVWCRLNKNSPGPILVSDHAIRVVTSC